MVIVNSENVRDCPVMFRLSCCTLLIVPLVPVPVTNDTPRIKFPLVVEDPKVTVEVVALNPKEELDAVPLTLDVH